MIYILVIMFVVDMEHASDKLKERCITYDGLRYCLLACSLGEIQNKELACWTIHVTAYYLWK